MKLLRRICSWLTILFTFRHGSKSEAAMMAWVEMEDQEGFNR